MEMRMNLSKQNYLYFIITKAKFSQEYYFHFYWSTITSCQKNSQHYLSSTFNSIQTILIFLVYYKVSIICKQLNGSAKRETYDFLRKYSLLIWNYIHTLLTHLWTIILQASKSSEISATKGSLWVHFTLILTIIPQQYSDPVEISRNLMIRILFYKPTLFGPLLPTKMLFLILQDIISPEGLAKYRFDWHKRSTRNALAIARPSIRRFI